MSADTRKIQGRNTNYYLYSVVTRLSSIPTGVVVREGQVRSWSFCLYCLVINPSLHQHPASSVLLMETHRKPEFPFPIDNKESSISFYWGVIKHSLAENEAFHHCPAVITSSDFPGGSNNKESAFSAGDSGSNPGLGRSPGEGNCNPL